MYFEIGAHQIQGGRNYQEDTYQVFFPDESQEQKTRALVVMADGMGGHAGGAVASRMVVESIISYRDRHQNGAMPAVDLLQIATDEANRSILDHVRQHPELHGMGCTLVAADFADNSVHWLSVGDSHLYLLRDGVVIQKNDDHSYGAYIDKLQAEGEVIPETPNFTPRRNMLMSYINGEEIAMVDLPQKPFPLRPGDRLIIASDGLDSANTGDFPYISKANATAQGFANALIAAVEATGKKNQDNTTVIVIDVYAEPGEILPVTEEDDTFLPEDEDNDDTLRPEVEEGSLAEEELSGSEDVALDEEDFGEESGDFDEPLSEEELKSIQNPEVDATPAEKDAAEEVEESPAAATTDAPRASFLPQTRAGDNFPDTPSAGKGKWIITAVAGLLLIAGGAVFLLRDDKPDEPAEQAQNPPGEPGADSGQKEQVSDTSTGTEIAPPNEQESGAEAGDDLSGQTAAIPEKPPPLVVRPFQDPLSRGGKGPEMVKLPAGTFTMGSGSISVNFDERPERQVRMPGFAMSRYEVTFAEYDRFVAATGASRPGDQGWGRDKRPVINVSLDDAQNYADWLARETGKKYHLPSETQWEYAARAGTTSDYWWGAKIGKNNANCWSCGSTWDRTQTAEVGRFAANPWGLYDTSGNVLEWTADCYHKNYTGAPSDHRSWSEADCESYVVRGGSYSNPPDHLRSAKRTAMMAKTRQDNLGFRLVVELD